jgi:hypothetical protein
LISKRTRNEFRETLVGWTLREIGIEFDNEGFLPDLAYDPQITGARRSHVEQLYRAIDFADPAQVKRLLRVFESVIDKVKSYNPTHAETLGNHLVRDGLKRVEGRFELPADSENLRPLVLVANQLTAEQILTQIDRLRRSIDTDPALAIGTAKELVESTCKTILADAGVSLPGTLDVGDLVKETMKHLKLVPDNVPNSARGAEAVKKTLRSLSAIVNGMAEMRNLYGSGHGPSGRVRGLTSRHARLSVGAATTLAMFLFETHAARQSP